MGLQHWRSHVELILGVNKTSLAFKDYFRLEANHLPQSYTHSSGWCLSHPFTPEPESLHVCVAWQKVNSSATGYISPLESAQEGVQLPHGDWCIWFVSTLYTHKWRTHQHFYDMHNWKLSWQQYYPINICGDLKILIRRQSSHNYVIWKEILWYQVYFMDLFDQRRCLL